MEKANNAEYHYEMVVNIVADMILEYLKATAHDIDGTKSKVKFDTKEGNQGKCYQPKKAA